MYIYTQQFFFCTYRLQLQLQIYKWEVVTFPMEFPATMPRTTAAIKLTDLIQDPNYQSEIHELAYDPHTRQLRKLNFMQVCFTYFQRYKTGSQFRGFILIQMQEIRRTGEFSVPSKNFPGQYHVWRLTLLLQKGNNDGPTNTF